MLNGGGLGQVQTITTELNKALDGREGDVRDLVGQLDRLATTLDRQRTHIVRAMQGLDKLLALLGDIRGETDEAALLRQEKEADAILTQVLQDYAKGDLDGSGLAAYRLVMDQVGRALLERRAANA